MKNRKKDHIELAFKSQLNKIELDERFNYEPLLSAHPQNIDLSIDFLGKRLRYPIWISSMTGGTDQATNINKNLAKACREFGLGMGLGSCRMLLDDDTYFDQFNLRPIIGKDLPLFANLGISQIEKLIDNKETEKINLLIRKLDADGLFVHVNPMQEYFQPEGDLIKRPPVEIIEELLELVDCKTIIKEVGQGMGPLSLKALFDLPIAGIEFGAFGGTNFANLELLRRNEKEREVFFPLAKIGHSAEQMVHYANDLPNSDKTLIISGGIKSFLDGYYLIKKSKKPAIYGQASSFLKYAHGDYDTLKKYVEFQIKGLQLASQYLTLK